MDLGVSVDRRGDRVATESEGRLLLLDGSLPCHSGLSLDSVHRFGVGSWQNSTGGWGGSKWR